MTEHLELLFGAVVEASSLLILPHNNPDPDAIASAVALRHLLAERLGLESDIAYGGIIGRAENKALVCYLGHPLRPVIGADLKSSTPIALVDAQPGARNHPLPPDHAAVIVFDHHPRRDLAVTNPAAPAFADVRPDMGATSTILTLYLQVAGLEPPPSLATALFYGIKTDTRGLSRGAGTADMAAYYYLQPHIDPQALGEIEHAQVPAAYFRSFDATLRAARVYDGVVTAYVGPMDYPDLAAEMADLLLRLNESRWVICMGVHRGALILSVRSRGRRMGAEQLVEDLVQDEALAGKGATAGGHGTSAGAQVPLGNQDPEALAQRVRGRILKLLRDACNQPGEPLV